MANASSFTTCLTVSPHECMRFRPKEVLPGCWPEDSSPQVDPSLSPDGKKLVLSGAGGDPASTIRILDLTTRQVSNLAGSQGLFSPRWSPDGRYLAALAVDTNSLHLFDFQTEKWTGLAKGT